MKIKFLILSCVLLLLFSCSPGKIYEEHIEIENYSWNRFKPVEFDVLIEDTDHNYDIYLAIRHITQIPYSKIFVNVTMFTPAAETRTRDLEIKIKDAEGNLLGDGLGDLWDLKTPIHTDFHFDKPGMCRIIIENQMPKMETIGIMDVGLVVRKTK